MRLTKKMFLIHWNADEAENLAGPYRNAGWKVELESADGARACKRIIADMPDVVVIYLNRLPSHGRETAAGLRSSRKGKGIPIIFVEGKPEKVEIVKKKFSDAVFTTSEDLENVLKRLF